MRKKIEGETWAHYSAYRIQEKMALKKYLKGTLIFDSTGDGKKGRRYRKDIYGEIGTK